MAINISFTRHAGQGTAKKYGAFRPRLTKGGVRQKRKIYPAMHSANSAVGICNRPERIVAMRLWRSI